MQDYQFSSRSRILEPRALNSISIASETNPAFLDLFILSIWPQIFIFPFSEVTMLEFNYPLTCLVNDWTLEFNMTIKWSTFSWFNWQILTCGDGSCWGTCPSSRVVCSMSPRICLRYWAMTVCCSTLQWFSIDRMTGNSDAYQTYKMQYSYNEQETVLPSGKCLCTVERKFPHSSKTDSSSHLPMKLCRKVWAGSSRDTLEIPGCFPCGSLSRRTVDSSGRESY